MPWLLFTGDFLFVGDVGRPDLLGEEARRTLAHQLYESVFGELPALPDFTEIFPAHGAGSLCGKAIGSRRSSTLGYERRFNAALQERHEAEWAATLLKGMPIAPPYFRRMKKVNAEGPKVLGPELPGQKRFTAKEVHERVCEHCLVVDVRPKEAFAAAHIPGSINIPLGHNLPTWAGWVLPYDRPILIVPDDPADVPEVVTHLLRVGFDDVQGYLEGGLDDWETHGFELGRLETTSVHDLAPRLARAGDRPFVLDVRTEAEWDAGHIEGRIAHPRRQAAGADTRGAEGPAGRGGLRLGLPGVDRRVVPEAGRVRGRHQRARRHERLEGRRAAHDPRLIARPRPAEGPDHAGRPAPTDRGRRGHGKCPTTCRASETTDQGANEARGTSENPSEGGHHVRAQGHDRLEAGDARLRLRDLQPGPRLGLRCGRHGPGLGRARLPGQRVAASIPRRRSSPASRAATCSPSWRSPQASGTSWTATTTRRSASWRRMRRGGWPSPESRCGPEVTFRRREDADARGTPATPRPGPPRLLHRQLGQDRGRRGASMMSRLLHHNRRREAAGYTYGRIRPRHPAHQMLQLHSMLTAKYPKTGFDAATALVNIEINMDWDGLFHAFTWAMNPSG